MAREVNPRDSRAGFVTGFQLIEIQIEIDRRVDHPLNSCVHSSNV
jgi:hypothetical protein